MKKAGILTFHRALNYGAVLQAYALKAVCDAEGLETHIIDYNFNGTKDRVTPFKHFLSSSNKKKAVIKLGVELLGFFGKRKREKEFISFRQKYLNESETCMCSEEIKSLSYDVLISGSDQIWNYKITGNKFDPVFFLDIDTEAKKIIYAASSQDVPFPLDMELQLKKKILDSDTYIGIREEKLSEYVAEITGVKYPVVLDPTLLAGKEIMSAIPIPASPRKPYILVHQIDSNPDSDISIKSLKRRFGCDVYIMNVPRIGKFRGRKGNCGPEKFLSLLKGAEFLVTNSFHGIALSLIFEKQFYVYENGGVMSRIDGLLTQTGLLNRKVKMVDDIDLSNNIDYKKVNTILASLRAKSMSFLKTAFSDGDVPKEQFFAKESPKHINVGMREKNLCCGCASCAVVCPMGAIAMKRDKEGFWYPIVDTSKCVNCGKCDNACGFKKTKRSANLPKAYGIKHKNLQIRESSRSGAAFVGFSDVVLQNGGVVYGAAMQDDFSVKHIRATTVAERDLMKKAKYVQSDTTDIFPLVEKDLVNGMEVLFSGTPCQVSGLKSYLAENRIRADRLVCCDMICHGVPSPMVWKDYLSFIEEKYNDKIIEANFRDKDFGWESHYETFVLQKKNKKIAACDYTDLFCQRIMFRPSCYNCQFTNVYRPGDLTMADFWGIEKYDLNFNDNHGVSLVLVNTSKGESVFNQASNFFDSFDCKVENCMQPNLYKPSYPSSRREKFWEDYSMLPFKKLIKKYTMPASIKGKFKKSLKAVTYHLGIRRHP